MAGGERRGGVQGVLILQVAVRSVIGPHLPQQRKIVFIMRPHAGRARASHRIQKEKFHLNKLPAHRIREKREEEMVLRKKT